MKILVIMGSPRKGNTYRAAKRIEDAMRSLGDVGFEYLMLGDVALAPCRGCMACLEWGEEHCPIRDDAPAVGRKLHDADGVIFASPVYGLAVTGQMKTFIDQFSYVFAPGSSVKKPSSSPPPVRWARRTFFATSTPSPAYGGLMSSPASVLSRTPPPRRSGRSARTTRDSTMQLSRSSRRWLRGEHGGRGSGASSSSTPSGRRLTSSPTLLRPTTPTGKNRAGSTLVCATTRACRSTRSTTP